MPPSPRSLDLPSPLHMVKLPEAGDAFGARWMIDEGGDLRIEGNPLTRLSLQRALAAPSWLGRSCGHPS